MVGRSRPAGGGGAASRPLRGPLSPGRRRRALRPGALAVPRPPPRRPPAHREAPPRPPDGRRRDPRGPGPHFARAGADLISVHLESGRVDRALSALEALAVPAGLVLQLETPVAAAVPYLGRIRWLTLLGTRIGVKGAGQDPAVPDRLREATRRLAVEAEHGRERVLLAADGAIRENTVSGLRRAGAEAIVMGSLAFASPDLAGRMAWIHRLTPGT
ncbi:MAG TPA: hypothetical protein VMG32_06865 [Anaeromyxobacteraceae bacterium]|nr:hypothetical protein [Anaeromyxobacteraceae bacterium]